MELVLASASPRRKELLQLAGFSFSVQPGDVDETHMPPNLSPEQTVLLLANRKAQAVWDKNPDACVVGADTVVSLEGTILGKPQDAQEAKSMLRRLSGKMHVVYTGVCIISPTQTHTFAQSAGVTFFALTGQEIQDYVATGEPMDKAGAYGIQEHGCTLVEWISGDFYTVMGLPIGKVSRILREMLI